MRFAFSLFSSYRKTLLTSLKFDVVVSITRWSSIPLVNDFSFSEENGSLTKEEMSKNRTVVLLHLLRLLNTLGCTATTSLKGNGCISCALILAFSLSLSSLSWNRINVFLLCPSQRRSINRLDTSFLLDRSASTSSRSLDGVRLDNSKPNDLGLRRSARHSLRERPLGDPISDSSLPRRR